MDYDEETVDNPVLALLYLTMHEVGKPSLHLFIRMVHIQFIPRLIACLRGHAASE